MNNIEKVYLISIERSGCFRTDNINNLKKYIKQYLNLNIHTVGIDCNDVYNNPERIRELQNINVFIKKPKWNYCGNGLFRRFMPGEIGCYLSHREVWLDMVKNNIQHALIFEDDSLIDPNTFFDNINDIMTNLPTKQHHYISLYHSPQKYNIQNYSRNVNNYIKHVKFDMWGTVSYILDFKCANAFINDLFPIFFPIDQAISKHGIENNCLFLSQKSLVKLCDKKSIIR